MIESRYSDTRYTSQEPGFKLVFVALVVAAILGLSFRLYFSPKRIKSLIEAELERRPSPVRLKFERAEFSLSRGSIPQIALKLVKVEGNSVQSCAATPGFTISEAFVPFKILSLLQGRVALGVIHGQNLVVDLDAIKDRCAQAVAVDSAATGPSTEVPDKSGAAAIEPAVVKPWWSADEWEKVSQLIAGVSLETLNLKFEKGTKSILFEDLLIRADVAPQTLSLTTDVRIPPELLFGQNLPPVTLEATARADSADIEVRGNLGEGTLMGLAELKAAPGDVEIDAHLNVNQVPISSLIPILQKAGWSTGNIKPRFIWLGCEVSISGAAKGLFKLNPMTLERCSMQGDAGHVVLDKATIGPPGKALEPLSIDIINLDVSKILAMTGSEGPSGIMTKYGSVAGDLEISSGESAKFTGRLLNSEFLFSSQGQHLTQAVPELKGEVGFDKGRWSVVVNDATIAGGSFKGVAAVEIDSSTKAGDVKLAVDELALNPEVTKLVVRGAIKNLALDGKGQIESGRMKTFKGRVDLREFKTDEFELPNARLTLSLDGPKAHGKVLVETARLKRDSKLYSIISPALFARKFNSEWIRLSDFTADVNLENRLFSWDKARVILPDGNMIMRSRGSVDDRDIVKGQIEAEDARFKNLRWMMSGNFFSPELAPDEATRQAKIRFENQKKN